MLVIKNNEPFWMSVFTASIQAGMEFCKAMDTADKAVLAKEARFRSFSEEEAEKRLLGTVMLSTAVQFYEHSALVGRDVVVAGCSDAPGMGSLRDFREGLTPGDGQALVKWTSGGPVGETETWVRIQALQLIAGFEG